MPRLFSKILLLLALSAGAARAQHPAWQHFTTAEGLPSNAIFYMLHDSRGMLWISTSMGICRFNGYEFIRPADTSGAATGSAFGIAEDARGRIWFMTLDGSLFIVDNDTVRAWPHSPPVRSFVKKNGPLYRFAVAPDGAVWAPSVQSGFLVVQPDGAQQVIPARNRYANVFTEIDGKVLCAYEIDRKNPSESSRARRDGLSNEFIRWHEGRAVSLGHFSEDARGKFENAGFRLWRLQNGDLIGFTAYNFYRIRDDRLVWHGRKALRAETIGEDADGSLLMTVSQGEHLGLLRFRSPEHFERDEFDNLLPGRAAIQALRDREGGLWVATTDAGLLYCKNPELDIFNTADGLPVAEVRALTSDGREAMYAGLRSLDIAVFRRGAGRPTLLPRAPVNEMQTLRFDSSTGRLWAGNQLCFFEKGRWAFARYANYELKPDAAFSIKKITPEPAAARWWASAHAGFFAIDPLTGAAVKIPQDSLGGSLRTFSVSPDGAGNLWVATLDGLRLWRDGRYERPPFDHPALRFQPRDLEMFPGGGMVLSLRGGGLLIRDADGHMTHLTVHHGLTADWLKALEIAPDGTVYACSNTGLNILRRQADGSWRIETLTAKHGLPSNQVNDVALLGDEIWIATDRGIARFRAKPAPAPMPPPQLERFRVNNHDTVFQDNIRLAHDQNNLALRFFALHFRSGGDIPYRYRLLPGDTVFTYSHTREVNFVRLSPGLYTFEVQAQNEDGAWSEPARFAFQIRPPWWAAWWFRLLMGAILVSVGWAFFQNRLQNIRREAAGREKIRALETAALRAQMNPHFIFNCLQAIQSFIAQNDREAAASYLARFAKLVRLALHGSVDGRHTLAEEIAMLDNYLHLEQLRFRGKFSFSIRVEDGFDPEEISLPPLLVQPFVENALLHGLEGRADGGFVDVAFEKNGARLEVTVTDNGTGFVEKPAGEITGHKSVGMTLTQKRLGLLGESGATGFSRETIVDADGKPAGARARLEVPILFASDGV